MSFWEDVGVKLPAHNKVTFSDIFPDHEVVPPILCDAPKIIFVGEAPGKEEAKVGYPFAGASGRLLATSGCEVGLFQGDPWNRSLAAFWRQNNICITNIIQEHPDRDNFNLFTGTKRDVATAFGCKQSEVGDLTYKIGGRYVLPRYVRYIEELRDLILSHRPNLVVAVGGKAAAVLCGISSIKTAAGYIAKCTLVPGVKVLPIIHPAAVLRNSIPTAVFNMHLMRAVAEQATPDAEFDEVTVIIQPTIEEVRDFFLELSLFGWSRTAADFETDPSNGLITDLSIAATSTYGISIPFVCGTGPYWSEDEEIEVWLLILDWMHRCSSIIWHNGIAYDILWLRDYCRRFGVTGYSPWRPRRLEDTLTLHHTLQPELPQSLNSISSYLLRRPRWKHLRRKAKEKLKMDE